MLLWAAVLKAWQLGIDAPTPDRLSFPRPLLILFVLLELGFGLWLLANAYPHWNHAGAVLFFLILFEVNLHLAISGHTSCPCLGPIEVSPWIMAVLNAGIVMALCFVRAGPDPPNPKVRLRWFVFAFALLTTPTFIFIANPFPTGIVFELRSGERRP